MFFFNKKIKIILLAFLILAGIFLVLKQTYAIWGVGDVGMFDINEVQLDALNPLTTIIFQIYTYLTIGLVLSETFVIAAAAILDWAVRIPINLGNPLVQAGWSFTLGLVNISFVLLLIFIALTYILRIETFEFKKTIPKLIIIILLVNFSLVLVGAVIDIAQMLMNTVQFGETFLSMAVQPLLDSLAGVFGFITVIILTYVGMALIPYVNVGAQVAIITVFFAAAGLGVITSIVMLIIINFAVAAVFFIFIILFLLRIVWLWFLAILSPLAFLAYVLPQTRGYFSKWFRALSQWAFVGVIALFLMTLGIQFFDKVINPGNLPLPGLWLTGGVVFCYLFLIVYLLIVYDIAKKQMPIGVAGLYGAWKRYSPRMIKAGKKITGDALRTGEKGPFVSDKWRDRYEQWSTTKEKGPSGWIKRKLGGELTGVTKGADKQTAFSSEQSALKQDVAQNLHDLYSTKDEAKRAGIISAMVQKGQHNDAIDKEKFGERVLAEKEINNAYGRSIKLKDKDMRERIERGFIKTNGNEFEKTAIKEGLTSEKELKDEGYASYSEKIIAKADTAEKIKQLEKGWWKDKNLIEASHGHWSGHQISEAARTSGKEFIDVFQENAHDAGWYYEYLPATEKLPGRLRNTAVPRYLASSTAAGVGMIPLEDAKTTNKVKQWEEEASKVVKEQKTKESRRKEENGQGRTGAYPYQ